MEKTNLNLTYRAERGYSNNLVFERKKFPMNQIFRNKKGFTLIEIAIALVIIGLLLGMGTKMIGPLMVRAKTTETNDILNAAVESVVGYALVNKKLPQWTDANDIHEGYQL